MKPTFITGSNAKIKVNGVTLAYCTDLSYSVEVVHAIPRVLGMYEGVSLEPISYSVNGSFSVVRYVRGFGESQTLGGAIPYDKSLYLANNGNGIGALSPNGGPSGYVKNPEDRRIYDNLDPASLESGNTFTIEVYQYVKNVISSTTAAAKNAVLRKAGGTYTPAAGISPSPGELSQTGTAGVSGTTPPPPPASTPKITTFDDILPVVRIRNARINRADSALNKKTVLMQRFSFIALYLDEDSFIANPSGYYGAGSRFTNGELGK